MIGKPFLRGRLFPYFLSFVGGVSRRCLYELGSAASALFVGLISPWCLVAG
jgi:hypothetical protein